MIHPLDLSFAPHLLVKVRPSRRMGSTDRISFGVTEWQ